MMEYCDHMGLFHTDTHVVFEIAVTKQLPKPTTYKGKEYRAVRTKEVHRGLKTGREIGWIGSFMNPEHFSFCAVMNWTGRRAE